MVHSSADLFEAIIDQHPASQEAIHSANLIADSYAKSGDWESLEDAAQRFADDEQLGDEAFEAQMLNIAARAAIKQVADGEATPAEAADRWLNVYQQYGDVHGTLDRTVEALRAVGRTDEAAQLVK